VKEKKKNFWTVSKLCKNHFEVGK